MRQIKYLLIASLVVLFSQAVCHAQLIGLKSASAQKASSKQNKKFGYYAWPIFFGGGTFFFSEQGIDQHWPGYVFSGGLTLSLKDADIFLFSDILYSYKAYDGYPEKLHYRIEESAADLAIGVGYQNIYGGLYGQLPMLAAIKVSEWTMEDFSGLSRTPSFSLMGGYRIVGKHLGIDLRLLLGQGPGQFLKSSFGNHWLGQASIGVMGGF